jgi:hypothetical protein
MNRHVRKAIVAALTVGTILLGTAGRAEAATSWSFDDGFEGSTTAWYADCEGCGYSCPVYRTCDPAYVSTDAAYANSGSRYLFLGSTAGTPGAWRSFGRPVRLPAGATACSMRVAVRVPAYSDATVNVEVIRTSSWTYETVRTYALSADGDPAYKNYSSGTWYPGPRDVWIRLAVLGDGGVAVVDADDFHVSCTVG